MRTRGNAGHDTIQRLISPDSAEKHGSHRRQEDRQVDVLQHQSQGVGAAPYKFTRDVQQDAPRSGAPWNEHLHTVLPQRCCPVKSRTRKAEGRRIKDLGQSKAHAITGMKERRRRVENPVCMYRQLLPEPDGGRICAGSGGMSEFWVAVPQKEFLSTLLMDKF